jgi:predicted metalloprotease
MSPVALSPGGLPVRSRAFAVVLTALVVVALAAPAALAQGSGDGGSGDTNLGSGGGKESGKGKSYESTLKAGIADIQNYWSNEFPVIYGKKYDRIPDNRIFAAHPGIKLPKCQGQALTYKDAENNAFYCYKSNFVAYDDVKLFPQLNRDFGALAVPLVLAHEWGHAVQDRSGNAGQQVVYKELQADCFAGTWIRRVADGDAAGVKLTGGSLDRALAAMIQFRDPTGSSSEDAQAHGSGFDRTNAFQDGYDNGAKKCATYFKENPLVVEIPFSSQQEAENGGNVPGDQVVPASIELLNSFYSQVDPGYVPVSIDDVKSYDSSGSKDQLPSCGGSTPPISQIKNRVFYCIDDKYFAFDEPYLQHVYDDIGDFGVATLLANPIGTYVEIQQNFPGVADNADNAVLGDDCYTGGFAAAMYNNALSSDTLGGPVALSPGDLDETVQAFIDYSAARGLSKSLDVTFARLRAFRDGFFNGYGVCEGKYSDSSVKLSEPSG